MSDAYQCDRCGGYESAQWAALHIDIEDMAQGLGGDIVLEDGAEVSWSRAETDADFCTDCAAALIEHIDDYLTDTGGERDE